MQLPFFHWVRSAIELAGILEQTDSGPAGCHVVCTALLPALLCCCLCMAPALQFLKPEGC